jgi:hypothetical protein
MYYASAIQRERTMKYTPARERSAYPRDYYADYGSDHYPCKQSYTQLSLHGTVGLCLSVRAAVKSTDVNCATRCERRMLGAPPQFCLSSAGLRR